ncbi:unnamed protein product, partial [Adineta ricciae]
IKYKIHRDKTNFSWTPLDFRFNDNRIGTYFKRNGNRAVLTMENNNIDFNRRLTFDLTQDVQLDNGELKFNDEQNVKKLLSDLITHINMLINNTSSSMQLTSHEQNVPDSRDDCKKMECTNGLSSEKNSATENTHLCQINLYSDQRQTEDDPFDILFQSIHDVLNSQPGPIPSTSPIHVSILNELTGGPLDNSIFSQASLHDEYGHGEPTLD